MVEKKKIEDCPPCQKNALLETGNRICHRIGRNDCHQMVEKVQKGRMTLDGYYDKLEKSAKDPKDKQKIQNVRKMFNI